MDYVTQHCDLTHTMRHELGHVLGLSHPNDHILTKKEFTVMSYQDALSYFYDNCNPITLQLYDILVLQNFYGQNLKTRADDTTYRWSSQEMGKIRCLWDAGGNDTIDLSQSTFSCELDMRDGEFSTIGQHLISKDKPRKSHCNFSIAFGVGIENAIASGHGDSFCLNACNNNITGGKGNDTLFISDKFINVRVDPRNPLYTKQFVAKQNYLDRKQYQGWGNDVFYPGGGQDIILLDLDHDYPLTFEKKGEDLIVTHKTQSIYGNQIFISSITIKKYNPKKQLIILKYYDGGISNTLLQKYKKQASKTEQILKTGIFNQCLNYFQNDNIMNFQNVKNYENKVATLLEVPLKNLTHYQNLCF